MSNHDLFLVLLVCAGFFGPLIGWYLYVIIVVMNSPEVGKRCDD